MQNELKKVKDEELGREIDKWIEEMEQAVVIRRYYVNEEGHVVDEIKKPQSPKQTSSK